MPEDELGRDEADTEDGTPVDRSAEELAPAEVARRLQLLNSGTVEIEGRMPWSSNATFLVTNQAAPTPRYTPFLCARSPGPAPGPLASSLSRPCAKPALPYKDQSSPSFQSALTAT